MFLITQLSSGHVPLCCHYAFNQLNTHFTWHLNTLMFYRLLLVQEKFSVFLRVCVFGLDKYVCVLVDFLHMCVQLTI